MVSVLEPASHTHDASICCGSVPASDFVTGPPSTGSASAAVTIARPPRLVEPRLFELADVVALAAAPSVDVVAASVLWPLPLAHDASTNATTSPSAPGRTT